MMWFYRFFYLCLLSIPILLAEYSASEIREIARFRNNSLAPHQHIHREKFSSDGTKLLIIAGDEGSLRDFTGKNVISKWHVPYQIDAAHISGDGQIVMIVENGPKVYLYNAFKGKELINYKVTDNRTRATALSPNGKLFASGDENYVKIFDLSGKLIQQFDFGSSYDGSLQFSPDNRNIAIAKENKELWIFNVDNSHTGIRLEGTRDPGEVKFSPDGKLVSCVVRTDLGGGRYMTSQRFWDSKTGKIQFDLKGMKRVIGVLPQGKTMLIADYYKDEIHFIDPKSGVELSPPIKDIHQKEYFDSVLSKDGKILAFATKSGTKLLETTNWKELNQSNSHGGEILRVAVSPDGKKVVTAGLDASVFIWNWPQRSVFCSIKGISSPNGVKHLRFSPDGKLLTVAAWGVNEVYQIYSTEDCGQISKLPRDKATFANIEFINEKEVITSLPMGSIGIWDAYTGELKRTIGVTEKDEYNQEQRIDKFIYLKEKNQVWWSASNFKRIYSRNLDTGIDTKVETPGYYTVETLLPSPNWEWGRFGSTIFNFRSWNVIAPSITDWAPPATISSDSRLMAAGVEQIDIRSRDFANLGGIVIWERLRQKRLGVIQTAKVNSLAFSPDNKTLFAATENDVIAWDISGIPVNMSMAKNTLDSLWEQFSDESPLVANKAAWEMSEYGKEFVDYLRGKLKPAQTLSAGEINSLRNTLKDSSLNDAVKAAEKLQDLGYDLTIEDYKMLRRPSEHCVRYKIIDCDFYETIPPIIASQDRIRSSMAIAALSRSDNFEAKAFLKELTLGDPNNPQTREALNALKNSQPLSYE